MLQRRRQGNASGHLAYLPREIRPNRKSLAWSVWRKVQGASGAQVSSDDTLSSGARLNYLLPAAVASIPLSHATFGSRGNSGEEIQRVASVVAEFRSARRVKIGAARETRDLPRAGLSEAH